MRVLALLLLAGCRAVDAHGPPETAYKVAYFEAETAPVREAALKILERWKVPIRSDDGRVIKSRPFKDGPSTWKMQVELEHSGGTTAVLVRMDILRGGDVETADVVETDYESIVRWQIGGEPEAFKLPERPTDVDFHRAELVSWLKRWKEGRATVGPLTDEERARDRRELFLGCLRMSLPR